MLIANLSSKTAHLSASALLVVTMFTLGCGGRISGDARDDGGHGGHLVCDTTNTYCDRTDALGLGSIPRYGRGVAFADFDVDGWVDLLVIDTDMPSRSAAWGVSTFYRNVRGTGFVKVEVGVARAHLEGAWSGSFADFDNDGDPDLAIAAGGYSMESTLTLYENQMRERGRFVDVTAKLNVSSTELAPFRWWGVSWADYDRDGLLDLVATRTEGRPLLFHNLGGGSFAEVAVALGVIQPDNGDLKNPVWSDIDGDGDPDLYLGGMGGNALYRNDGATFTELPDLFADIAATDPVSNFATLAEDFDQDGRDDLLFGRWTWQTFLLHGNGDGTFVRHGADIGLDAFVGPFGSVGSGTPVENAMGLSVVDLFDDGIPDIFVGTGAPDQAGPDLLFCGDGDGHFSRCSTTLVGADDPHRDTRGHGTAQADIDNDGDLDVFVNLGGHSYYDRANPGTDTRETCRMFLFEPNPSAGSATIELEGTSSNRDAIGARLVAHADRTTYRTVRSAQGFQSQNGRAIVIPLGASMTATVHVDWPRGATSDFVVARGDRVHVLEP